MIQTCGCEKELWKCKIGMSHNNLSTGLYQREDMAEEWISVLEERERERGRILKWFCTALQQDMEGGSSSPNFV